MSNTKLIVSVGGLLSFYVLFALVLFPLFIAGCTAEPIANSQEPVSVQPLQKKKMKIVYAAAETRDMDNDLWHVWTVSEEKQLRKWRYRCPVVMIDVGLEDYNYVEVFDSPDPLQWYPTIHLKSFDDVFLFDGARK